MKIIDLLNKIANGEEAPKKIKYKNKIYEWKEYDACYGKIMTKKGWVKEHGYVAEENRTYFYLKHCYQDLNDTVEILEEEKKIPEKITINDNGTLGFPNGEWTARNMDKAFATKFNQLIDYLESKGE